MVPQEISEKIYLVYKLFKKGLYMQAIPDAITVCDYYRSTFGEVDLNYAESLSVLGSLYQGMGNYITAEPIFLQALEIIKKAPPEKNNLLYRRIINIIGGLHQEMRNDKPAVAFFKQALELERKVGENHSGFANVLNNLALQYYYMGYYAKAESHFLKARKILLSVSPEEDTSFFHSILNNLALLYNIIGDYAKAEQFYKETLENMDEINRGDHINYASTLNNLGILHLENEQYSKAKNCFNQASTILRKTRKEQHPLFASVLNSVALIYKLTGNYADAIKLYNQSLKIEHKVFGENNPIYAGSLNNLAYLYRTMGKYTEAKTLYFQALEIMRKALLKDHPNYALCLKNLADLLIASDNVAEAIPLMQESAAIDDSLIKQIFTISSESQRLGFLNTLRANLYIFLSMVRQSRTQFTELTKLGLELVLNRKAIVAESLVDQRETILSGRYPELRSKLHELMNLRNQIAQKTLAGSGLEGKEDHIKLLSELSTAKDNLEQDLVHQIPEMNIEQKLQSANIQSVAQALPADSVLIEFIHYHEYDFKAVPARGEKPWKPARYMAFVLLAGKPDDVKVIDLGKAKPIDEMISGFRASIYKGEWILRSEGPMSEITTNDGTELCKVLFKPLITAFNGCTRIFLAPDGDLNQLPFETLPNGDGRRLIDDYQFSYLSVGRDILRFGTEILGQCSNPLVIASPNFDLDRNDINVSNSDTKSFGRQSRAINRKLIHFSSLPGTHKEGKKIAKKLGVEPWLENDALEGKLKTRQSPHILHISTHGYFLENSKFDPNQIQFGVADSFNRLSFGLENPLLRSGLALAGANTWLERKPLPLEAEDAMLNAEDVSGLNLLGTELVVLSACNTGMGEIRNGEGVFGLRRAFVLAGARTLVMSLWKVPDRQTRELMEIFYDHILDGESRAGALHKAQLTMKKKYPDPLYWGAFICQGDPSPLQKKTFDRVCAI